MSDAQRNPKVLIPLALSGRIGDVRTAEFGTLVAKLAGGDPARSFGLDEGLRRADAIGAEVIGRIARGVAAAAAFGIDRFQLATLLNYLEVDEARYFKWDSAFLDLLTMSELESLALDTGLAEALGARFRVARAGKKADFIKVLLAAKDFAYPVPTVMRYPRRSLAEDGEGGAAQSVEDEAEVAEAEDGAESVEAARAA